MSILGDVTLGDIHAAHDFDAANQCGLQVLRWGGLFDQLTVNAVFDLEFALERFHMDVRSSGLDGFDEQQVHQVDESWLLRHAVDVIRFDGIQVVFVIVLFCFTGQVFGHPSGGRAVCPSNQIVESFGIDAFALDGKSQTGGCFVRGGKVHGVRHDRSSPSVFDGVWHDAKPDRGVG